MAKTTGTTHNTLKIFGKKYLIEFTDSEISVIQTLKSTSAPELTSILNKMKILSRKSV